MFKVKCIKCSQEYDSDIEGDQDYCTECRKAQIVLAKEIDEKIALRRANEPPRPTPKIFEPIPGTNRVELNYRELGL